MIRKANLNDAKEIAEIYNYYIRETAITFETEIVDGEEITKRIEKVMNKHNWLVYEDENKVSGYAYYCPFRDRSAYDHTVESTIYFKHDIHGKGWGRLLYEELIKDAEKKGFREMIGVISLPNEKSIALHDKCGFKKVGHMEKVGFKFGKRIDIGIWQKHLNSEE